MAAYKPPDPFVQGLSPAEAWRRWRQRYEIYYDVAEISKKNVTQQRANLLHVIGEEGLEIYFTLDIPEIDDNRTVAVILDALTLYFTPYKNTTYKRFIFFTTTQAEDQSIDQFVTELKAKSRECEFENLVDSLVRDRLLCGLRDKDLQTRLLREPNLTLSQAIDICRADESSKMQNKVICGSAVAQDETVHSIKQNGYAKKKFSSTTSSKDTTHKKHGSSFKNKKPLANNIKSCSRCGRQCQRKCPAYGKECGKCHKIGHFAVVCRSAAAHGIEEHSGEDSEQEFVVGTIEAPKSTTSRDWRATLNVHGKPVQFKLDSGAEVNVLPTNIYNNLQNPPSLKKTKKIISTYSGHKLPIRGKCELRVKSSSSNNQEVLVEFYVVETEAPPILGLDMCETLNLISRVHDVSENEAESLVEEFDDVFTGIGCLPMEHHIRLKQEAQPKVCAARKIPFALKDKVKNELQRMKDLGVIEKVSQPTEWVHPMVTVEKPNGSIRICLDPRALNEVLMREHYQMPTPEVLLSQLKGAKYFTLLDVNSAFWQVPLSEESSFLTTFSTPFGRYRFCRLPFGIASAPEVFLKIFSEYFDDIEGIVIYMDDLLIWGSTLQELNQRFRNVLKTAREINVKFSKEKLKLAFTEVQYCGETLTSEGIKINSSRIEAIQAMDPPNCKKELQSFLGMVTYLTRFLPNLSSRTAYLRSLLHKGTEWVWDQQSQNDYDQLKELISKDTVLKYFDPNQPVIISVDASRQGLGAVLQQSNRPVAYASVSLTPAQSRYAPIETELLAIVYGLEHFHYYVYGRSVTVETDHKPLLAIVKKPFQLLSPRLQRMLLRLQRYQYTLVHVPGSQQYVADTLSRKPNRNGNINTEYLEGNAGTVHLIAIATPSKLEELRNATKEDLELQAVNKYVTEGWPVRISQVNKLAKRYWSFREELHQFEGLVYKGQRLVVPEAERPNILDRLHSAHQGIVACKDKARESMYWPTMNAELEQLIQRCKICQAYSRANTKEPLLQHPVPHRPWEKVGIDIMKMKEKSYLVIIDYFSKYIELQPLTTGLTAQAIISVLKPVFARHGVPDIVFTDNGPPFNSTEFKEFCNDWDTIHETSSPTYPRSNGMVERVVQTVKTLLNKAAADNQDPYKALLQYRATPHQGLPSPAALLMGRRIRTSLPTTDKLLKPNFKTKLARERMISNQNHQKRNADKSSKPLEPFKENQSVLFNQSHRNWLPAKVKKIGPAPRSYIVETSEGVCYRRNRINLRAIPSSKDKEKTGENQMNSNHTSVTPKPTNTTEKPISLTPNPTITIAKQISLTPNSTIGTPKPNNGISNPTEVSSNPIEEIPTSTSVTRSPIRVPSEEDIRISKSSTTETKKQMKVDVDFDQNYRRVFTTSGRSVKPPKRLLD